jgi:CDGSH-type Zn-finger protein
MSDAEIKVRANGPYVLRGSFVLRDAEGNAAEPQRRDGTVALCRCGASAMKPFCDGSHKTTGFSDPGRIDLQ